MRQAGNVFDKLVDSGYASREMPDQDEMELAWVHGYRGFDCRNNLRYDHSSGKIIYFTANIGIVLALGTRPTQKYFRGHTDDILSMGIFTKESETLVVTGQRGKAKTLVWSAHTMELKASLQTNQKSIAMIEFSGDGRLIISIGEDNTVAVTEWANQRLIANVKGEPAATFHMVSSGDMGNLFLTCGDKYMRVWSLAGRNLTSTKLSTSPMGKPQKFIAAALFQDNWIVGCENGGLYVISKTDGAYKKVTDVVFPSRPGGATKNTSAPKKGKGKNATSGGRSKAKGEEGPTGPAITAMYSTESVLLTGTKDGNVYLWGPEMNLLCKFDITTVFPQVTFLSAQIQSLCFVGSYDDDYKILIGTRGCDVLELTGHGSNVMADECSPILHGHCNDELWGLAVHPKRPEYCTVGDDKTLRVWSIHDHTMTACILLGTMARACAYHPTGRYLAVGFGGRVGRGRQKEDGKIRVYSYPEEWGSGSEQLEKQVDIRDSKQWISDVKFSPDGNSMAVGSHDNIIYIYSVNISADGSGVLSLTLRGKFNKHNSYITHLDFSADGRFLQSNCGAYELLFCDTSQGKQITSASELRDVRWHTWTCSLGWPVQGIWPAGADGTDINAVDRSNSGHLLATSDDFGNVRVLRYPCVDEGADALVCSGHSSHVMNVRWTVGDEYLISCGGNDKSIFQWKHSITTTDGSGGGAGHDDDDCDDPVDSMEELSTTDMLGEPSGGDEFMAVKPWRGAIRAPDEAPPTNPSAPSASLALQWIHGYTSGAAGAGNSRISSNLFYGPGPSHDILYPAAALGVCLSCDGEDRTDMKQQYFNGHDDDILCLTLSPCKRYVATG